MQVLLKDIKDRKYGFTLVELLIVVVLVGILAAVGLTVIRPEAARNQSRDSVRIANVKKLADAAEVYANLEGGYPESQAALAAVDYLPNWPDGSPTGDDAYVYSYTSGAFTVSVANSSGGTYEYHSDTGQLYECLGGICEGLSGGLATDTSFDFGDGTGSGTTPPSCDPIEVACFDGTDNDCDGLIDCADLDCQGDTEVSCSDGVDNNCNGFVDCADTDCQTGSESSCSDSVDNDCDGNTDYADADCCGATGASCDYDFQCCGDSTGSSCYENLCLECEGYYDPCSDDSDCCSGYVCISDRCMEPCQSLGGYCSGDSDCCSPYICSGAQCLESGGATGTPVFQ
ncbi:prepilin-type N-terminal cleavage/methylation domain-containing protein [candidate division WWE3 bacterium]|nr:prepilin-type N-terminal cleavage/methylation domain-containing protein [candidate division WWE3 bacterium]